MTNIGGKRQAAAGAIPAKERRNRARGWAEKLQGEAREVGARWTEAGRRGVAGTANGDELCSCSGSARGLTRTKGEREMDRDGRGERIRRRT